MLYGSWNRCSSSPWCCKVTRLRSDRGVGRLMSCSGTAVPDVRPSPSVFGRRRRSWGEGSRRKCTLVPHHSSPWPTTIGKNEDQLKDHMVRTSHGHKLELTNSWQLEFACRTKLCRQGNVRRSFLDFTSSTLCVPVALESVLWVTKASVVMASMWCW